MEHIKTPKVENVKLLDRHNPRSSIQGTLYLTATHLIFVDPSGRKETWILHMHIQHLDKQPMTTTGAPLLIRCKNFLSVTFVFPYERDCYDIYTSLQTLSQPMDIGNLYAFNYTAPDISDRNQGWDLFDIKSEYLRMGVPNENWVLSNVNKDYELCDTYPQFIYTPAAAPTQILIGSARFRSKGRLPVLSYLHRDNQAAICRSSQPLSGFSARCVEDEQMLQYILEANPKTRFMFVVDTRPKINAMANRAAGKGYENENHYTNIKFQFLGIENIHVMRSSLNSLVEACDLQNPTPAAFLSGIEASGYLKHIKSIFDTSCFIAKAITEGISVMVHCSDGWDRTAQTCGLASLMLDPYYRTIQGFQNLIEKEWLAFGHKFTDRCGMLGTVESKERAPVFSQFIDCVWQLMQQFPHSFQFNQRYLYTLHDHVYSCQYGTFIGNCEKDRIDLRLRERTYSLWAHMSRMTNDFLNPFYKRETEITIPTLIPNTSPQSIKFWRGLYMRYETRVHPRENVFDNICALKDHSRSMEEHIALLEKRLSSLCHLLGKDEEELRKVLSGLASSESIDLSNLLHEASMGSPSLSAHGGVVGHADSDTESGFEDSGSQMSKSLNDHIATLEKTDSLEALSIDQIKLELKSVAVDWKSFRSVKSCNCAMPFEHFTKKYHCWRCGNVFCTRCIDRLMPLPGHLAQSPVPVCKACYKDLRRSPSSSLQDLQPQQKQPARAQANQSRQTPVNSS